MAEYKYEVVFKSGRVNSNADALSRNPVITEVDDTQVESVEIFMARRKKRTRLKLHDSTTSEESEVSDWNPPRKVPVKHGDGEIAGPSRELRRSARIKNQKKDLEGKNQNTEPINVKRLFENEEMVGDGVGQAEENEGAVEDMSLRGYMGFLGQKTAFFQKFFLHIKNEIF